MTGLVLRSTGSFYRIQVTKGIFDARLGGRLRLSAHRHTNPVAVGDRVNLEEDSNSGELLIVEILSRKNYLIRKSTRLSKETQIIASNIDLLLVVASLKSPRTSTGFLDRLLVTAEAYDIPACLVINKSDLISTETDKHLLDTWNATYASVGYPVHVVSAFSEEDLRRLRQIIQGKTCLFSGHSGAGKSSLINGLAPNLDLKTGGISTKHQKGKHTTTFAEMFFLDAETAIIDTPGIKEFGLFDMEDSQISHYFPEIFKHAQGCRFQNCLHLQEPDCAVEQAAKTGKIPESRYVNYLQMLESNQKSYKR